MRRKNAFESHATCKQNVKIWAIQTIFALETEKYVQLKQYLLERNSLFSALKTDQGTALQMYMKVDADWSDIFPISS